MKPIFYVGDIHGRVGDISNIMNRADAIGATVIQVGDFGLFWPSNKVAKKGDASAKIWYSGELDLWLKKREKKKRKSRIITCGGNHDNWNAFDYLVEQNPGKDLIELYPGSEVYFAKRGALVDIEGISHLFLGGAESSDKHNRKADLTWWSREEPSAEEFDLFFEKFDEEKPNTVVTHEAPLRVELYRHRRNDSYTPNMLENVFKLSDHRPRYWYFGHHHLFEKWKVDGTKFHCCGLHGQLWQREEFKEEVEANQKDLEHQ